MICTKFSQNTVNIMDLALLHTKFLIPHRSPTHIERPELVKRICGTGSKARIMLIAPPGYGKTILLTAVTRDYRHPLVWIQLDSGDNDPATFMAYLVNGLRSQLTFLDGFNAVGMDDSIAPQRMLVILLNHLLEQPDVSWMLVFDDYHVIHNADVHDLVTTLLENMPPKMRVMIASRSTPPLPLSRWRAQNQLLELKADHLRFSTKDVKNWLERQSRSMPDMLIKQLVEKTEGWGAGLQLAMTLLNEHGNAAEVVEQLTGIQPYIFDYLMDEVFTRQPLERQDFLLRSSVFTELNPETCATVLKLDDSYSILKTLENENLFISRLDYQRQWYRYHHLFRDFLLSRFQIQQPDSHKRVQRAAAQYFAEQTQHDIAIQHFINAKELQQAATMLLHFADDYLVQGRFKELQDYLVSFSDEIRHQQPELFVLQGRILRYTGQLQSAISTLKAVFSASADEYVLCRSRIELAAILHSQGAYQAAYDHAQAAVDMGKKLGATAYVPALMQMARCAGFVQGMDEGRKLAEEAYRAMRDALPPFSHYEQARLLQILGQICWWHGDGKNAIVYCRKALRLLDERNTPLKARLLITLATPTLYQKDYDKALHLTQQAINICQELQLRETLPSAYAALGNVLTRIGELEQAESTLQNAIRLAEEIGGARYSQVMAAGFLAQNLALQGRINEARHIAEHALAPYENEPIVYDVYVCRSVLADLLLDNNQLEEAKNIYRALINIGETVQYRVPLAMAYFGLAYILMREQQQEQAVHYSQQSLALLEPAMLHQLYLDQRERALLVCESLVQKMPDNTFIRQVYRQLTASSVQVPMIIMENDTRTRIQTLGSFKVWRHGHEIDAKSFASAKARDMLAYFVMMRHKSIALDRAIDALWEDGTGSISGFHTALYRMRGALRNKGEREKFILSEVGDYRLDVPQFDVDVDRFDTALKRARSVSSDAALTFYDTALSLYQGEYLDNLYYDWLTIERERIQRDYIAAVRDYSQLLLLQNQYDAVHQCVHQALAYAPYQEPLHILFMTALHHLGDHQAMMQHYQHLKTILRDVFNAEPAPETQAAYQKLILQRP
ncbi:MAG: BTAD domain-containing putative transcriptional regulator [Anaerolineae bacterium]|nr:BTAD domain-containing putative transcriptional regulator [Anaerolineae bacterium]